MLVIKNLDAFTLAALKAAAARNGRCLDAEIACILAVHLCTANASGSKTPELPPNAAGRCSGAASNGDEVAVPYAPNLEAVRASAVCGMRLPPAPRTQLERVGGRECERVTPIKSGLRMLLDVRAD